MRASRSVVSASEVTVPFALREKSKLLVTSGLVAEDVVGRFFVVGLRVGLRFGVGFVVTFRSSLLSMAVAVDDCAVGFGRVDVDGVKSTLLLMITVGPTVSVDD